MSDFEYKLDLSKFVRNYAEKTVIINLRLFSQTPNSIPKKRVDAAEIKTILIFQEQVSSVHSYLVEKGRVSAKENGDGCFHLNRR